VGKQLGIWVSNREIEKWRIQWPVAEGTLEALKGRRSTLNIGTGLRIDKPKKADYAIAIGRAEALEMLAKFADYAPTEEICS